MQDHGSDAVNIMANATVELTKGTIKASLVLINQLLSLAREGMKITSGETNINKLIKSLDAGDRIESATIPKDDARMIAELAKQHGVVYAMAENREGNIIVYYRESEAPRMKNILEDILQQRTEGKTKVDREDVTQARETSEVRGEEENRTVQAGEHFAKETEVTFDVENPQAWVEICQYEDGSSSCHLNFENQETIEAVPLDLVSKTINGFQDPTTMKVKGHYSREQLQTRINQFAEEKVKAKEFLKEMGERETLINNIYKEEAGLDGTLHLFVDQNNPNNRIAIYKYLERQGDGIETVTKSAIYVDGMHVDNDPVQTLQDFGKYRYSEKNGNSARKQFKKMELADRMTWRRGKEELEEGESPLQYDQKKPLEEYLAGIEKIRKEQPMPAKDLELQLKTPDTKVATMGER